MPAQPQLEEENGSSRDFKFLDVASQYLRDVLSSFLLAENIFDDNSLFSVLRTPEANGQDPFLLQQARQELRTGAYLFLRTACLDAGCKLASSSHGMQPPAAAGASANDDLPDFLCLEPFLDSAHYGEPLAAALPLKKDLTKCDNDAANRGTMPCEGVPGAAGKRPFPAAILTLMQEGWDLLNDIYGPLCSCISKKAFLASLTRS